MALSKEPLVGIKSAPKILVDLGRRLSHHLPFRWGRVLDKTYDLFTKFNVVEMSLKDLSHLPPVQMPDGFDVCLLESGSEEDYIAVMRQSLKKNADPDWFHQNFSADMEYNPENLILIYKEKNPVAAAAAWQKKYKNQWIGQIKSVGVVPDYRGRGLGLQVSLTALHRLRCRGFQEVMLKTHTSRLPAIHLYLSLGFEPRHNFWFGKRKWRRLLTRNKK
jgi:GNAT superfamily N-acetyltransferase